MLTFIFSFINNLFKLKFLEFFYLLKLKYHFAFNFLRFFCITISVVLTQISIILNKTPIFFIVPYLSNPLS